MTRFNDKDLDKLTPRLQRLKLRLMRYSYVVKYTPERELILADMLSRSPIDIPEDVELSEEISVYVQDVIDGFPSIDRCLSEIISGQRSDPIYCELRKYYMDSWPSRHLISEECSILIEKRLLYKMIFL